MLPKNLVSALQKIKEENQKNRMPLSKVQIAMLSSLKKVRRVEHKCLVHTDPETKVRSVSLQAHIPTSCALDAWRS